VPSHYKTNFVAAERLILTLKVLSILQQTTPKANLCLILRFLPYLLIVKYAKLSCENHIAQKHQS